MIDDCSIYVICWPMDFWNTEKFLHLSASLLSTSYGGFASFCAKRPHNWPHYTACSSPSMLHSCTSWYLFVYLVPSPWVAPHFLLTWKICTCFLCLGLGICRWKACHTEFHAFALCSPCISAFQSVSTIGLRAPQHMAIQNSYGAVPGTWYVYKRYIHSIDEWMNRTSCISQAYGILTSMCARVCIKVPVWKDHESLEWMEEYFFFSMWFCVCMRVKKMVRRHQLICKFVTIVGTGARSIY